MEHMGMEDQVSIVIDDQEDQTSDSEFDDSASSSFSEIGFFTRNGMALLEYGNSEHRIIERSFLKGLGQFGKETKVVAIHKNSYSSPIGQARMESFRIFSEAVRRKSGGNNANVKYAWFGASRDEICEIVTHGFGRFRGGENSESCGLGVPHDCEKGGVGGVIDWCVPNTPPYGFERIRRTVVGPSSPYMTFPTLLSMLSRFLPRSKMVLITKFYSAYRDNKLSRIQLIQKMRRLAGDKLLIAVIKFDRKKQLQARIKSSASGDLNSAKRYAAGA
ncbi:hypothetical protein RHGRI_033465 [Rhododendron griersonianum]|uniref:RST domain-containing protein n=1 Tax=Rhododendron griersonianum TaxID=479676 RepID=A0AAV6HZH6_9ERIC|nr:hypothetical protein RHGRI_033465 [Rhododendron griersonianum]